MVGLVALQFVLGWLALAGVMSSPRRGDVPLHTELAGAEPVPTFEVVSATVHQANGALVIAVVAVVFVLVRRMWRGARQGEGIR